MLDNNMVYHMNFFARQDNFRERFQVYKRTIFLTLGMGPRGSVVRYWSYMEGVNCSSVPIDRVTEGPLILIF